MKSTTTAPTTNFLTVALLLFAACDDPHPQVPPPPVQPVQFSAFAGDTGADPSPPGAPPSRQVVDEERVEDLLDRWLAARSRGDLTAYGEFYAAHFEGLLGWSASHNPYLYDRTGWLRASRERFISPRRITIEDLQITVGDRHATVTFVESDTAGAQRIEGPKELRLVDDGGVLRIESEAMVEREKFRITPTVNLPTPEQLALVIASGEGHDRSHYFVLDDQPDIDLFTGHFEYLGAGAARTTLNRAGSSSKLGRWRGRRVQIFDANGTGCRARVDNIYGLSRVAPGSYEFGENHRDLSDEEKAQNIGEIGGPPLLVAHIEWARCSITEPVWGRAADEKTTPLKPVELEPGLQERSLATFQSFDEFRAIQQQFYRQTRNEQRRREGYPFWWNFGGAEPEVHAFRAPHRDHLYAFITVRSGPGCGEFFGAMSELFELRDHTRPWYRRLGAFEENTYIRPLAMVDLQDGTAPLLIGEKPHQSKALVIAMPVGSHHRIAHTLYKPYFECGC